MKNVDFVDMHDFSWEIEQDYPPTIFVDNPVDFVDNSLRKQVIPYFINVSGLHSYQH